MEDGGGEERIGEGAAFEGEGGVFEDVEACGEAGHCVGVDGKEGVEEEKVGEGRGGGRIQTEGLEEGDGCGWGEPIASLQRGERLGCGEKVSMKVAHALTLIDV